MMQVEARILRKNIQIFIINATNIISFNFKALKTNFNNKQTSLVFAV